ncbi:MAG: winged helix-turn-helix transcriptional regulator [Armatimonadota bacterium]|nr:winged helix-turn-helix transcriptional regulator [Armatimonadota bacterium]MDW8103961.1 winged helix-turn-helix transcriptional regulator [Armatimonadota bacterium]
MHNLPYTCITEVLKCKWTLAILDAIARGVNRPGRIERELPGLTTKVLNERIRKLEHYGILRREVYPEVPPRVEYVFTERGKRLIQLLAAINDFARQWEQE